MANHVTTSITFDKLTEKTVKILEERFENVDWGDTVGKFFKNDLDEDRQSFIELIGSKWCNLEDKDFSTDSGYAYLNLCSAWCLPEEFILNLNEYITELQEEDFVCEVRYEDEVPLFAGAQFYKNGEHVDGYEESWDEIFEAMKVNYPDLCELIEKEDEGEDLTEEEQNRIYDERMNAVYDTIEQETIRFFKENNEG